MWGECKHIKASLSKLVHLMENQLIGCNKHQSAATDREGEQAGPLGCEFWILQVGNEARMLNLQGLKLKRNTIETFFNQLPHEGSQRMTQDGDCNYLERVWALASPLSSQVMPRTDRKPSNMSSLCFTDLCMSTLCTLLKKTYRLP